MISSKGRNRGRYKRNAFTRTSEKFEAANKTVENGIFIEVLGYVLIFTYRNFVTKLLFCTRVQYDIAKLCIEYKNLSAYVIWYFMQIGFERILPIYRTNNITMITQSTGAIINIILDPINFRFVWYAEMVSVHDCDCK